ncbi:hypothetical protein COV53_05695 [Candidatus Gottesmanbacteria bacterium CG11_big_fil_rev_8_21_14_0_20_37_11]|uniref:Methyltransferase type 11 domain-containing protein n=1 Tax=Candidatus Gottesmanbacteria bacterium CG11_big_fil_rev_8_21_14_0_20_37_11 TaxID=1974575 RepID=A0A2H0NGE3_9BACT|nr:MAG: hypothetical protein COX23_00825 [Candidatus Gottesmanbacteria bacterium CG23_combo_of_CG06-09_8_20_14_all_37_19]PIR07934.1 MAG: hypothetical protein COV53_05695 [Candidatus Gottesmanbacteria bacterium CG11_big_fil_rev_8_21_14_0_20_37_11]
MIRPNFFISPHFIAKYYLLRDIKKICNRYQFSGSLLDIGCGNKPYKDMFTHVTRYEGIDYKNCSNNKEFIGSIPDYYFSRNYDKNFRLPFDNNSFDNTVSFQVLEHHPDYLTLIGELFRVTKKGGMILISAPFLWPLHEEPRDFQRITQYGIKNILQKDQGSLLCLLKQGSVASTVSIIWNEYLINISKKNRVYYLISIVVYLPFLMFSYSCLIWDLFFKSSQIYFNYLVLIRKTK